MYNYPPQVPESKRVFSDIRVLIFLRSGRTPFKVGCSSSGRFQFLGKKDAVWLIVGPCALRIGHISFFFFFFSWYSFEASKGSQVRPLLCHSKETKPTNGLLGGRGLRVPAKVLARSIDGQLYQMYSLGTNRKRKIFRWYPRKREQKKMRKVKE